MALASAVGARKVLWLSTWMIHNANHLRENSDGLKVGGHQASSASLATIMSALYFSVLRPEDRVAVKPHASPVFHAIQYLFGRQSRDKLENFRGYKGAQSYPSRTKDVDDVDFSTGSVGLGVAQTLFASLVQDYVKSHGWMKNRREGRMIALVGDAEMDEGNIFEALLEGWKHGLRNTWWVVDYNRQSLDATTADRMFDRFDDIFETAGWRVVTLSFEHERAAVHRLVTRRSAPLRVAARRPRPGHHSGPGVRGRHARQQHRSQQGRARSHQLPRHQVPAGPARQAEDQPDGDRGACGR